MLYKTSFVAAECGRHAMPPPACNNPTSQAFIADHGSWYNMLQPSTTFDVLGDALSISALISLVILASDLLTSKLVRIIVTWSKQSSYKFWCFWDFSFSTYGETPVRRTKRPWEVETFEASALVSDTGLRAPSVFQVWSLYAFPSEDIANLLCEH